jgi:hypothetical protein
VSAPDTPLVRIDQLNTQVLAYVGSGTEPHACAAMATAAGGLVVRGMQGASLATKVRKHGYTGPLLVDPACYEHEPFHPATYAGSLFGLDEHWLAVQQEQRVAAYFSPSEYVPSGDRRQLKSVLEAGQRFSARTVTGSHRAPAFVALPADRRWLTHDLDYFTRAVAAIDEPIALILAHPDDPLGSKPAVEALVHLLRQVPAIALLRTDLAGLGALSVGAIFAGIGITTSLRHLVPFGVPAGGTRGDRSPRVLVPPLLAYKKGSWLAQLEDDDGILDCTCGICASRTLRRFDDPALATEAHRHSVLSWRGIADRLLAVHSDQRPGAWAAMCSAAVDMHEELGDLTGIPMSAPDYLKAWATTLA